MALVIAKRCIVCKHKLVQSSETKLWECKNENCPEYVSDKVEPDNEQSNDQSTEISNEVPNEEVDEDSSTINEIN